MKNLLLITFLVLVSTVMVKGSFASNVVIYIAEPLIEDDIETGKTLISLFTSDVKELKKIYILPRAVNI